MMKSRRMGLAGRLAFMREKNLDIDGKTILKRILEK
jgi:hypothetical protein